MNKPILRRTTGAFLALAAGLSAGSAHAYNWKAHSRQVEVATQLMQTTAASTPAPAGIPPALWAQYLQDIAGGAAKLGALKTGLPNAGRELGWVCGYKSTDDMSQIPNDRIEDMSYLPLMGGNLPDGNAVNGGMACSEIPIACPADQSLRLGKVLGWMAAAADEHEDDTILWSRPTSWLGLSAVTSAAADVFTVAAGALILPFACFVDWFEGNSCSIDQANNLANQYNPVTEVEGLLPGIGRIESYDYVGVWHFIDVAGASTPFDHNPTRGMLYEQAGPNNVPGALDLGIMAATDLVGLSLNAGESKGVSEYGQYDRVPRTNPQWQALALGHTEFSPISNLGYYGWQQFIANPSSAYALNWPLHAIGDASAPHHVAGTTAWGHRPYEDEVDDLLDTQLLPPPHSCTLMPGLEDASSPTMDPAQATRILTVGYGFWSKYQSQFGQNQLPFREMVLDEAQQAYALAQAGGVYDDPASLLYLVEPTDADRLYSGRADAMRPLLELGTGTMIAFLAGVAKTAQDPGANGSQTCPPGTLWDSSAAVCDATGSPPPSVNPGNPPITLVGGDDDGGGQASCSIATCSDSAPCASGFYCDASGCCQEALK